MSGPTFDFVPVVPFVLDPDPGREDFCEGCPSRIATGDDVGISWDCIDPDECELLKEAEPCS